MLKQRAFHQDIPVIEFVPGTPVYLSQQGDLCLTAKAHGIETGCKSVSDLEVIEDEFRAALAIFDSNFRVQQTLFNTSVTDLDWLTDHPDPVAHASIRLRRDTLTRRGLYQKDLYFTFILQSSTWRSLAQAYWIDKMVDKLIRKEYSRVQDLITKTETFMAQASHCGLRFEEPVREETKLFLNRFVSFRAHNIHRPIPHEKALDYYIPNASPHLNPGYIWHDGHYLQAISVRELPRIPDLNSDPDPRKQIQGTHAGIFKDVIDIDCPFLKSVEWRQVPSNSMRTRMTTLHKNHDSQVTSFSARYMAGKNDTRSDLRQDPEALRNRDEVGAAKVALSQDPWGEYSYAVILHAPTLEQVENAVPHVFTALRGATVIQEDVGIYDAWTNTIPGNFRRNERVLWAPIRAAVDTFLLWSDSSGEARNEFLPSRKALAIVETQHRGLHYLNLHDGQTFGVAEFGEQGSGKTTFANHVAENVARQWVSVNGAWVRPKMLIFDMKDSYRENTLRNGGTYLRMTLNDPGMRSNPWSLPYSKDSVEIIVRLIKAMLSGDDNFITTPEQDTRIKQEIEAKYIQKKSSGLAYARLRYVNLGEPLQRRLDPWIGNGQYARFFDNDCDDLDNNPVDWLTIQLTGFGKNSYVIRPLLYWHWERFMALVHDPAITLVPKFVLLDEAHVQMMMNPEIGSRMLESINTGRSYNLWNMFVMQWAQLLHEHPLGPALIAACPVKIFCASQNISAKEYSETFEMPLHTAELIKSLIPRREFIRYSAGSTQKLSLVLDPVTLAVYANDVVSNAARYARQATA